MLKCSFNLTMWNKVATTKHHADKEIFGANAPKKSLKTGRKTVKINNLKTLFLHTKIPRNLHGCGVSCIQKPRHCGGVKKSLSGEQRKEAPNVIIY